MSARGLVRIHGSRRRGPRGGGRGRPRRRRRRVGGGRRARRAAASRRCCTAGRPRPSDERRVTFAGADSTRAPRTALPLPPPARRLRVPVVPARPELTAWENVLLPRGWPATRAGAARRRSCSSSSASRERARHYPTQLSGGEQQRIAMARAFVIGPARRCSPTSPPATSTPRRAPASWTCWRDAVGPRAGRRRGDARARAGGPVRRASSSCATGCSSGDVGGTGARAGEPAAPPRADPRRGRRGVPRRRPGGHGGRRPATRWEPGSTAPSAPRGRRTSSRASTPSSASDAMARLAALANVRDVATASSCGPVDLGTRAAARAGAAPPRSTGWSRGHERTGSPSSRAGRCRARRARRSIERGLAGRLARWRPATACASAAGAARVVGVAVEPDNVAFPLAARPRVYLRAEDVRREIARGDGGEPVNAAYLRVRDRDGCRRRWCRRAPRATATTGLIVHHARRASGPSWTRRAASSAGCWWRSPSWRCWPPRRCWPRAATRG